MLKDKQKIQREFLDLGVLDPKNKFKNEDCMKILSSLNNNFSLGKRFAI